jgi:LacI family transcriptional regulator
MTCHWFVDTAAERIGYQAARLLVQLMRGRTPRSTTVLVPPRRIDVRQSSNIVALDDPEIALAMRFIHARACESISVKDLLQEVPISRRSLERRFEKSIGRSPKAEIMRLRIHRARQLLAETNLPASAISKQCGFTTQDRFSVAFRRECRQTPTEYRRSCVVSSWAAEED